MRHLHAFAREVKLTEAEWLQGIDFLTRTGHISDDKRQEFILLSDTLGLSMLTVAQNNDKPPGCTEATVFGPFYVEGAPQLRPRATTSPMAHAASPARCAATVRGLGGEPVPAPRSTSGRPMPTATTTCSSPIVERACASCARRSCEADAQGRFHFRSIVADGLPDPARRPGGRDAAAPAAIRGGRRTCIS